MNSARATLGLLFPEAVDLNGPAAAIAVRGIEQDSRRVSEGDVFVAVAGLTVDGHDFAARAVDRGAVAVVAARPLELPVPCLVVDDPLRALGCAAHRFHGEPCRELQLTGITGTNGKTTTAHVLEAMLQAAGREPGLIGTVAYRHHGHATPAPYTTPTPLELHRWLAEMRRAGCDQVVMEVSSHGLQLGRVWGCDFAVAAFSHLTQDHLDLHGTMDAYLAAKLLLFTRHLRPGGTAVVNVDGDGGEAVLRAVRQRGDLRLLRCSRRGAEVELQLRDMRCDLSGVHARLEIDGELIALRSPLLGSFNADNLLLAAGCAHALGLDAASIAEGARVVRGVPGRLERVDDGSRELAVLVDYAHTPDALRRAIEVLRPLCPGRLLVLFGCGGDRDQGKRPLMGRAVADGADLAVVTSDNPRSEDPLAIIEAIIPGVASSGLRRVASLDDAARRGYWVEPDRAAAIASAVASLTAGDVLLIAGKGHEDYQILADRRIHFDDREHAREALRRAGNRT